MINHNNLPLIKVSKDGIRYDSSLFNSHNLWRNAIVDQPVHVAEDPYDRSVLHVYDCAGAYLCDVIAV